MKVALNWLREFVELPVTVDELVSLLTMAGVEVEGVATTGCAISNVVVAEIRESVPHPNADRLGVCQVDHGTGTLRQIVCGAKNYRVGDKVPLALPGAQLAPDFTIKAGKLRGVESQGMLCSADELGLPPGAGLRGAEDGLLILPPDAAVGTPISSLFPGDTVLDLEITPNRPDLLSHAGMAREIAALTGKPLAHRSLPPLDHDGSTPLQVAIETAAPCYYSATLIRAVKISPSADRLQRKLEAIGLRAINNAVDFTNWLMMDLGQPAHVFDAAKVEGVIRVREARDGETIAALDGRTYPLAQGDLVIADNLKPLAIAGVIGGEESAVTDATRDVILEIASFDPARVRRTARRLGLSTDSSYRFERGLDPATTLAASAISARTLAEWCGAESFSKASTCRNAPEFDALLRGESRIVPLRPARVRSLLGANISDERIDETLSRLGLKKQVSGWQIPTFRLDLAREVDLIEETARVIGMDCIPSRTQARFAPASSTDRSYDLAMTLRQACAAQGLHEARSLTLVPAEPLGLAATQTAHEHLLRVKNPMIDDQVVLRPNLLHGLLRAVTTNLRGGEKSVRLFEIGRVYSKSAPEETQHLAIVLCGPLQERSWRDSEGREADLFALKGTAAAILGSETSFIPHANPALALSLRIAFAGVFVGFAGQLWPAEGRAQDAETPVVFAEIDLTAFENASLRSGNARYSEIPRYPATRRDIAMLASTGTTHAQIESTLRDANEPLLAGVELFDVFTDPSGARVPEGQKSLAYSLIYRSADRTLTADEVNAAHLRLKQRLIHECHVTLRE
jgi:phenylalanyl-tRNA synthetase beta chain